MGTSLTFAGLFSLLTLFGTQLHGREKCDWKVIWFNLINERWADLWKPGEIINIPDWTHNFFASWASRRNPLVHCLLEAERPICSPHGGLLFVALSEDLAQLQEACPAQFLGPTNTPDLPEGFACCPVFLTRNQNKFSNLLYETGGLKISFYFLQFSFLLSC